MSGVAFVSAFSISGDISFKRVFRYAQFSHLVVNSTTGNSFTIATYMYTTKNYGTYVYAFNNRGIELWTHQLSDEITLDGTNVGINK